MSKYPVETSDLDGVIAGVNYLLSGPAGLGQNFSGQSFQAGSQYFSGNPRAPFLFPESSGYSLNVAPISLSSSEMLDEVTYKFTFSSTQGSEPFYIGCPLTVSGVTNDTYNQTFTPVGVVKCTTTYVIARSETPLTVVTTSTGGTVKFNVVNGEYMFTDCQADVNITGATDRVFLSGQISFDFLYDCVTSDTLFAFVTIFRSQILNKGTQTDPLYYTDNGFPVFSQTFTYNLTTGDVGTKSVNAIFTSFIDQNNIIGTPPSVGYYNYALVINFATLSGNTVTITSVLPGTRTLTAQVVKE